MGDVRIVSGRLKGRRLKVGPGVRPTGARLREALFSHWGDRIEGAVFLDLFAGTGAMGIEAWSRGARRSVLFEQQGKVLALLRKNASMIPAGVVEIVRARLPRDLGRRERDLASCEIVFADPPYDFEDYEALLVGVEPFLTPSGTFALEHPTGAELPSSSGSLVEQSRRRYGDSTVSIYGQQTA